MAASNYNINLPMSLKTVDMQPTVFTPYQFDYKPRDLSIMERSLATQEARQKEANEKRNAVDLALSGYEQQMHNDEQAFMSNYKADIEKEMQDRAAIGDYGSLLNYAINKPGEISKDSRILGRVKANNDFKEFQKLLQDKRNKGELSDDDFNYLQAVNKYSYEDKQIDGNFIQGDDWKASRTPVKSFNLDDLTTLAFKRVTPKKGATSSSGGGSSNVDKNGNILDITTGSKHSSSIQYEKVILEDVREQLDTLINTIPDGLASVEQHFDSYNWKINQMEEEYNNIEDKNSSEAINLRQKINQRKALMYGIDNVDNKTKNYKEFLARLITEDLITKHLVYDWKFTDSSNINDKIGTKSKSDDRDGGRSILGTILDAFIGPGENVEHEQGANPSAEAASVGQEMSGMVE